jgi:proline racemase
MRFNRSVRVVGAHAEGEVGNVVVGGFGQVPGETMFDKRNHLAEHRDWIRRLILSEPRGQVARNANIILPSNHPDADAGYVIMESIEYPVMSGSNTICVATVLLETGMLDAVEPVTNLVLESPAGLIPVECQVRDGKVTSVRFTNQPAFVHHLDAAVEVEGVGTVTVDVAWGGMACVILDARGFDLRITPDEARDICALGERIKIAAAEQLDAVHPENPGFPGITICEFTLPPERIDGVLTAKNTVVVSPGRCDRSPCGTGSCARMAVMHARGELAVGEPFVHTSIIDSRFECRIESRTTVGAVPAIVPSIAGQAWITDLTTLVLDPTDPYQEGYRLTDTWPSGLSGRVKTTV